MIDVTSWYIYQFRAFGAVGSGSLRIRSAGGSLLDDSDDWPRGLRARIVPEDMSGGPLQGKE